MTRIIDIILSAIAIAVLLPILLPIMILLKLTGEHYVFYMQPRVGKHGKQFPLLKFATMLKDSPNLPGGLYTSENDPRMLPMGKFLRKTKINELPQLLNILAGDMSIIGYRPTVKEHFSHYPKEARKKLWSSRPGLSGIGSIVFRNEEEMLQRAESEGIDKDAFHRDVITPYKADLECWYVKHRNIFLYFKMIELTVDAVLHPESREWKKLKGIPEVPKELEGYL